MGYTQSNIKEVAQILTFQLKYPRMEITKLKK